MKDAKLYTFGILKKVRKTAKITATVREMYYERKEASQMYLASFHIKRDTEKSISANLGISLPRQCPCS